MVFRLGEMSHQPPERVMEEYELSKGKGWGVMAKNMGIKLGSPEFKALNACHDLDGAGKGKKGSKAKGKKEKTKHKGDEFVKSHDGDDEVKSSRGKARES